MLFIIPGLEETLRINGKACIVQDEDLLERMQAFGKKPVLGIGVEVEECFMHCAKAFKRSQLWDAGSWPKKESLPVAAKIIADHVNIQGITSEEVAKSLKETYEKRLY
ncbi:hypothetical protein GCM10010916_35090 [Paenibacillus abyssi]|uniref:Phosphohydrolase n=1 Tax=Paenibacillus abyssi TaxID=1340531 RepID=A0A917LDS8_9BACL|nr:hypothetical protein GCM10010916_35090 [Paenibacillus abyssi]